MGFLQNDVTYNTLIHGFCKEGQLKEANKVFREMKATGIAPNVVTYNTPINGHSQTSNSEEGMELY